MTANAWPPPPDLASIKELVQVADVEGFIADGAPADEYDGEAELLFGLLEDLEQQRLTAEELLPLLEGIWRKSFSLDETAALEARRPSLTALAEQIERFSGPRRSRWSVRSLGSGALGTGCKGNAYRPMRSLMTKQFACVAGFFLLTLMSAAQSAASPASDAPVYTSDGSLLVPVHYREWIYLTSGIDMSYAAESAPADHSMFDNVFVNPASYRSFLRSGTWPDKTTMVLETRGAENPVSINRRGHTQSTEVMGMEIHVKDHGEWKFYDLSGKNIAANLIPRPATCYTCHEAHAAVDTTFVQFYPTLLPLAKEKKTLSPEYLKELPLAAPIAPGAAK